MYVRARHIESTGIVRQYACLHDISVEHFNLYGGDMCMNDVQLGEGRRRKRTFSQAFRDEVIECCQRLGVSVAGVARAYDLHPDLLRRWVAERERSEPPAPAAQTGPMSATSRAAPQGVFLPLEIGQSPTQTLSDRTHAQDIRIELRHQGMTAHVAWPISASEDRAAWLHRLMR